MADRRAWPGRMVLFAFAVAGLPAAASASERLVIPFDINRLDHMVVEMQINGANTTTGVIDTAATFAMVDSRVALRSGVLPPGDDPRMVNILGVNGEQHFPVVYLDSVKAGNASLMSMAAAFNDGIDVPGAATNVLPASAFPGDVLEFDFAAGTISAYDGRPDISREHYAASLPYEIESGLIFVEVSIDGRKGRALVDTGASLSYVNSAFAKRASMRRNEDLTHLILGATGDREQAWYVTVRKVRLADFVVNRPNLLVSDPVLLERLGLDEEPIMVLGLDFLSQFRMQFDRRKKRLILSVPGQPSRGVSFDLQADATRLR